MSSQEVVEGTLFNFDSIVETEIIKVDDALCLPYNPFTFDITLRIVKSQQPFEQNLEFVIASGCKSVFGRNKVDVEYILKAPTVSSKHFVIDENQKIADLGSTKGTFIWVQKQKPIHLEEGQIFLIGKKQIVIERIYFEERRLILKIGSKVIEVNQKEHPFLIGSHKKCQLNVEDGKSFMALIDVHNFKFHSFLENEDYECEQGVWERLSVSKQASEPRILESADMVMVFPYILRVEY